jgi:phosphoglycolate phosphatase-like HAD superfamily hydrolase
MNQNTEIDLLQTLSDTVEDYFNIPRGEIKRKTRKPEIKEPRQIAMTLALNFLLPKNGKLYSKTNIGIFFGKDHATVIHANKTINNLLDTDRKLKSDVDEIRKRYFKAIEKKQLEATITKEEIKQAIYEAVIQRFKKMLIDNKKQNMKMSMFFDMNKIINDLKQLDT